MICYQNKSLSSVTTSYNNSTGEIVCSGRRRRRRRRMHVVRPAIQCKQTKILQTKHSNHYCFSSEYFIKKRSSIRECKSTRANVQNLLDLQKRNSNKFRQSSSSLLLPLLLTTTLLCFHNAPSCFAIGNFDRYHHVSLTSDNNPFQQQFVPQHSHLITDRREQSLSTRMERSNNDPSTEIMSSASSSFTPDPSGTLAPPNQADSIWSSLFGGLGGQASNRPQSNNNGGGGGGDGFDNHIKKILVPRVSGTRGNVQVRDYIVGELTKNGYNVELDEFTGATPIGNVKFANIIASSNPDACRQLVLACHYDSKMMDGFLGATDSAVPCAMLLTMSEKFNKSFRPVGDSTSSKEENTDSLGLRFIFFDGEEAFDQWTSTDSLYGSRHLAAKWAKERAPAECNLGASKSELNRIELFVLLDLIGASDTSFVMYDSKLKRHYEALQKHEREFMAKAGYSQTQVRRAASFRTRSVPLDFMEDDHVPFKKRGVPILLLLAHPFPKVWHTVADNYGAIDFAKTRRILHSIEQFVANYQSARN